MEGRLPIMIDVDKAMPDSAIVFKDPKKVVANQN